MAIENYYALLNMPITADAAQLDRALKRQSEAGKLSLEQARAIRHILLNPERRRVYDRLLQQAHPQAGQSEADIPKDDISTTESVNTINRKPPKLLILGVLLPVLLLAAWLGTGYLYKRNMQDAALSPSFVQGLQSWVWRDLRMDYDDRRGLAINDSLDILSNSKQATQHPYIAAMNDIRTEYRNQGQQPYQPIAWLHNQGLLVGGDVWTLGSSGARKRFSMTTPAQDRQQRTEVVLLPQRRTVLWMTKQDQDLKLLFLDSDNGRQITYALQGRGRPYMAEPSAEAPPAAVHFSADERYMLITYFDEDHVWMLEHNPDGQIQNLRHIGSINRNKHAAPAHATENRWYRNHTQAAWLASPHLITVHENGDVRHWSLPQLQLQRTETLGHEVRWAQFSDDGKHIWLELETSMNFQFARYTLADKHLASMETHIAPSGRYVLGNHHLWLYSWQDKWSRFLSTKHP
ncbi:hypothetical protein L1281_001434 [Neisseria sp. HSC-16F19]|nr:hypothetical protein [Neisseria sp. HSC-16F19]MCP2040844.1 hypothetical protein [Neisseria sp. HSC-16F19]